MLPTRLDDRAVHAAVHDAEGLVVLGAEVDVADDPVRGELVDHQADVGVEAGERAERELAVADRRALDPAHRPAVRSERT